MVARMSGSLAGGNFLRDHVPIGFPIAGCIATADGSWWKDTGARQSSLVVDEVQNFFQVLPSFTLGVLVVGP